MRENRQVEREREKRRRGTGRERCIPHGLAASWASNPPPPPPSAGTRLSQTSFPRPRPPRLQQGTPLYPPIHPSSFIVLVSHPHHPISPFFRFLDRSIVSGTLPPIGGFCFPFFFVNWILVLWYSSGGCGLFLRVYVFFPLPFLWWHWKIKGIER